MSQLVSSQFKQRGFSLIEVSIALVIIGVITMASFQAFTSASYYKNQVASAGWLEQASSLVVKFAQTNNRLPCPDVDLDGFEDCSGNKKTGTLPFYSLGMPVSSQISDVIVGHQNLIYGVYRDGANDADLTVLAERTGDVLGDANFQNVNDFKVALSNAFVLSFSAAQPYVTGDVNTTGAENCTTNQVANAAFWIASSGGLDADEDGNPFDSVNELLKHDGTGTLCFTSPTRRHDALYDDKVKGLSFSELIGLL